MKIMHMLYMLIVIPTLAFGKDSAIIDFNALCGKRPTELRSTFHSLAGVNNGSITEIKNWRGWQSVYLSFNNNGKLVSISLIPKTPVEFEKVKRILTEVYGVSLPASNKVKALAGIFYRGMSGNIRTVNFSFSSLANERETVGEIGIFYNL